MPNGYIQDSVVHHHIAASYHIQSWLISLWLWTELIAVLFPNSFWFYSRLNYCESLLLSSICEQDNREFQIISAHAALFGHSCFPCPFLFSTPVDSPSHPISYSLPSQMSCYIPLKTIISDFNMTENVRTYSYVAYSQWVYNGMWRILHALHILGIKQKMILLTNTNYELIIIQQNKFHCTRSHSDSNFKADSGWSQLLQWFLLLQLLQWWQSAPQYRWYTWKPDNREKRHVYQLDIKWRIP